ncbi:MAG: fluoride efflux transporter CrcB [Prevotellaceae bacterium]|jgi:CrcB protein|nr:fluoride efflux transporter CrcB [Prevotellaceae bacterium]
MVKEILLVGLGGGAGSILRYLASRATAKAGVVAFPAATLAVNVLGCFLIGVLVGASLRTGWMDAPMKALLVTGFCGGFTTFSAFSLENVQMYQAGSYATLALYVAASVAVGFAAVWAGMKLASGY